MNEATARSEASRNKVYEAFYDSEAQLFVVDFAGTFPFADSSNDVHASNGMFTHGISTDGAKYADGRGYMAFNRVAITERHLTSDFLPEALQNGLSHAVSKLSRMYEGAPKEWHGCTGQLRCEKAAQLLTENQTQMIDDLIASYNDFKQCERA